MLLARISDRITTSSEISTAKLKEKILNSHEDLGDLDNYVTIKATHEYLSSSPEFSLYIIYFLLVRLKKTQNT